MANVLFELGCEELPPKALYGLSEALFDSVCAQLTERGFKYADSSRWFASPRRLAFVLTDATETLPDQRIEKRGPSVQAAFDDAGEPRPAALGFARSVGAEVADLEKISTDKGEYLAYTVTETGQALTEVLPQVIQQAIKQLPIPKPMRWGNNEFAFIRPVHWIVLLQDQSVVPMTLFGINAGNQTRGHRFHHNDWVEISDPGAYVAALKEAGVMVDQNLREDLIAQVAREAARSVNGEALINKPLLQEVASITEQPVAVLGQYDEAFLQVPREALVSSMEKHQKYFPVGNSDGELMPYFVALANIGSSNPAAVKKGFEKVITPRLADARFFWEKDQARALSENIPLLQKMVFEQSLGSIADKSERVGKLMEWLAPQMGFDAKLGVRAATLMKSDLMSDMVDEFPDLQGLMGGYYAEAQGEPAVVAHAIRDQYLPKFVGDEIPANTMGQALAMADKVDTLCGIFAVGKKPTGSKDPFALRRAALSVINILRAKALVLNPADLLKQALSSQPVDTDGVFDEVWHFFMERMKNQYQELGVSHDVLNAATGQMPASLVDLEQRLKATMDFKQQDYAKSLIEANKRSRNIIKKSDHDLSGLAAATLDEALFEADQEKELANQVSHLKPQLSRLLEDSMYSGAFELLADLADPLDAYFEHVMVNVDDEAVRTNRLTQLAHIAELTSAVADLSHLLKD